MWVNGTARRRRRNILTERNNVEESRYERRGKKIGDKGLMSRNIMGERNTKL